MVYEKKSARDLESKKKKKKLNAAKSENWDERVSYDIQSCEIFFTVFNSFLNETAFNTKLLGCFSGSKTEVTEIIALKFGTNI